MARNLNALVVNIGDIAKKTIKEFISEGRLIFSENAHIFT